MIQAPTWSALCRRAGWLVVMELRALRRRYRHWRFAHVNRRRLAESVATWRNTAPGTPIQVGPDNVILWCRAESSDRGIFIEERPRATEAQIRALHDAAQRALEQQHAIHLTMRGRYAEHETTQPGHSGREAWENPEDLK